MTRTYVEIHDQHAYVYLIHARKPAQLLGTIPQAIFMSLYSPLLPDELVPSSVTITPGTLATEIQEAIRPITPKSRKRAGRKQPSHA